MVQYYNQENIMKTDYFAHKSKTYEKEPARVDNVKNIADAILKNITYTKNMEIMDFGSGTGLLTSHIAPYVKKIVAVDMSASMNKEFRKNAQNFACKTEIVKKDMSKESIDRKFDAIISSMTLHHVEDTLALFKRFYNLLDIGGSIALSDLDKEDGNFHKEDTGVFHLGFDRDKFLQTAREAGFKELKIESASVVKKPYGEYGVFLLTGKK